MEQWIRNLLHRKSRQHHIAEIF